MFKLIPEFTGYSINHDGVIINKFGKKLKSRINARGYLTVDLYKRSVRKHLNLGKLVYSVFVGPISKSQEICYKDGNKLNTNYTNLYINPRQGLPDDAINCIKNSKLSVDELAIMFDRSKSTIYSIRSGHFYLYLK
jgi:hypothetical protein